jgi:two-component system response regulator FixJ
MVDDSRRPKIFIVDDDAAVRDSLKVLLTVHGLAVEDYESVAAFEKGYHAQPRACLLLDQHMAVTTGLEFLTSPQGRRLSMPVILITGRGDEGLRAQALEAGVAAFLEKPVASELLIRTIRNALEPP